MSDILAVVGPRDYADVRAASTFFRILGEEFDRQLPDRVISGGAIGGDILAEDFCAGRGVPFSAALPPVAAWAGSDGYRARDEYMADKCTRLLLIGCRWPMSQGAVYTANYAEKLGKPVTRYVLPEHADSGRIEMWDGNKRLLRLRADGGVLTELVTGPDYAREWLGEPVDARLTRQRKLGWRVRWTTVAG